MESFSFAVLSRFCLRPETLPVEALCHESKLLFSNTIFIPNSEEPRKPKFYSPQKVNETNTTQNLKNEILYACI